MPIPEEPEECSYCGNTTDTLTLYENYRLTKADSIWLCPGCIRTAMMEE